MKNSRDSFACPGKATEVKPGWTKSPLDKCGGVVSKSDLADRRGKDRVSKSRRKTEIRVLDSNFSARCEDVLLALTYLIHW